MVPPANTLSTLSPAFSALDCMELSNCHATHRFTITPATYCPQHRRSWTLLDHALHWHLQDLLIFAFFSKIYYLFLWVGFFSFFHFLALVGHVYIVSAMSDQTEAPVRVQLFVYPDDTRTVPVSVSPCLLVWECRCLKQKCDNSVNKQT